MKKAAIAAIVLAATAVPAAAQHMKAEDQVKYRRAAYDLLGLNFAGLNAMSQGKKPFNAAEAERNAQFVALLATVPRHFFGEGTQKGTHAKPGIWTHRADFDAKMDKMVDEAQKMPEAVRSGETAMKSQVAALGKACKACHDEYRAKSK